VFGTTGGGRKRKREVEEERGEKYWERKGEGKESRKKENRKKID
jgi:hypothetical protein